MKLLMIILALALTSCGGELATTKSTTITLPKVPEVDPDRPKTGREAIMNVPWTPRGGMITKNDTAVQNYIVITEDELQHYAFCGAKIDGKWQWVKPEAMSQITWESTGFATTEYDIGTGKIGGNTCEVVVNPGVSYYYNLKNGGNTLELKLYGAETGLVTYEILKN